jgi:hypothetical protein
MLRWRVRVPRWMASSPVPVVLLAILAFTAALTVYGLVLAVTDKEACWALIKEDGPVEWLTFAALVLSFGCALLMVVAYRRHMGNKAARRFWALLAVLFLLAGLEEISYGQRAVGFRCPDFLDPEGTQGKDSFYNRQGEVNLHNLVIYGVDMNKLLYGKVITAVLFFYFVVVPVLYRRSGRFRRGADRWGVPIIQNYQLAVMLPLAVAIHVVRHWDVKVTELLEMTGCLVFLVLITHPLNEAALPRGGALPAGRTAPGAASGPPVGG